MSRALMRSSQILRSTILPALRSSSARSALPSPLSLFSSPSLLLPSASSSLSRSYHARVIDHYENPRNVGSMNPADPNVGTGLVGAPACGDVMKLQLRVDESTGIITEARFKTFGCGSAIASSSLATTMAQGRSVDDVLRIKNSDIAKHLSLPPVKLHCSMLAEDAIKAAVKDYQKKKATRDAQQKQTLGSAQQQHTAAPTTSASQVMSTAA